jgi:hypothetical protein
LIGLANGPSGSLDRETPFEPGGFNLHEAERFAEEVEAIRSSATPSPSEGRHDEEVNGSKRDDAEQIFDTGKASSRASSTKDTSIPRHGTRWAVGEQQGNAADRKRASRSDSVLSPR